MPKQKDVHFQPRLTDGCSEDDKARLTVKCSLAMNGPVAENNATEAQWPPPATIATQVSNQSTSSMEDPTRVMEWETVDWNAGCDEEETGGDNDDIDDEDHPGGENDHDAVGVVSDPAKRDDVQEHAPERLEDDETNDTVVEDAGKKVICGQAGDDDPSPSSLLTATSGNVAQNRDMLRCQNGAHALLKTCERISPSLFAYITEVAGKALQMRAELENLRGSTLPSLEATLRELKLRSDSARAKLESLTNDRKLLRHLSNDRLQRLMNAYRLHRLDGTTECGNTLMHIACRMAAYDGTIVFAVRGLIMELRHLLGPEGLKWYLNTYTGTDEDAECPGGCKEWASLNVKISAVICSTRRVPSRWAVPIHRMFAPTPATLVTHPISH